MAIQVVHPGNLGFSQRIIVHVWFCLLQFGVNEELTKSLKKCTSSCKEKNWVGGLDTLANFHPNLDLFLNLTR